MMGSGRRQRVGLATINPFVVLVDCTIALSFILVLFALVKTLESSQSLKMLDRKQRQEDVRSDALQALQRLFPGSIISKYNEVEKRQFLDSLTGRIAEIFENGSYQRITIDLPQFARGSQDLSSDSRRIFGELGRIVSRRWRHLSYLNIHGIADKKEVSTEAECVALSRARADTVLALLQEQHTVAQALEHGNTSAVPLKYVVAFGTGSKLYGDFPTNSRVDLVLFFADENEEDQH